MHFPGQNYFYIIGNMEPSSVMWSLIWCKIFMLFLYWLKINLKLRSN